MTKTAISKISAALRRVEKHHERIVVQKRGKDVALLLPLEDLRLLEDLEDRLDNEEADRILADPEDETIGWDEAEKILGS